MTRGLARAGLGARRLDTEGLARLLYGAWCPDLAGVQRLRQRVAADTAPVVGGPRAAGAQPPTTPVHLDGGPPQQRGGPRAPGRRRARATRGPGPAGGRVLPVGQPPGGDAWRFARGARDVADLIAPGAVEVARDHVRVDRHYLRTLAVTAYPRTVAPGWLAPLLYAARPARAQPARAAPGQRGDGQGPQPPPGPAALLPPPGRPRGPPRRPGAGGGLRGRRAPAGRPPAGGGARLRHQPLPPPARPHPGGPGRAHPARGGRPGRDAGPVPRRPLEQEGGLRACLPLGDDRLLGLPQPGHQLPGHHLPLLRHTPWPWRRGVFYGVARHGQRPGRPRPLRRQPGERQHGRDRHLRGRQELQHQAARPAPPPAGGRRPGRRPRGRVPPAVRRRRGAARPPQRRRPRPPQPLRPPRPPGRAAPAPGDAPPAGEPAEAPDEGEAESGRTSWPSRCWPCWPWWRCMVATPEAPLSAQERADARPGPLPHLRRRRDHRRPGDPRPPRAPAARPLRRAPGAGPGGRHGRGARRAPAPLRRRLAGRPLRRADQRGPRPPLRRLQRPAPGAGAAPAGDPPHHHLRLGAVRRARRPRLLVVDEAWSVLQYREGRGLPGRPRPPGAQALPGAGDHLPVRGRLPGHRSRAGRADATPPSSCCSSRTGPPSTTLVALFDLTAEERQFLLGAGKGEGLLLRPRDAGPPAGGGLGHRAPPGDHRPGGGGRPGRPDGRSRGAGRSARADGRRPPGSGGRPASATGGGR